MEASAALVGPMAKPTELLSLVTVFPIALAVPAAAMFIRCLATVAATISSPLTTLVQIPTNWFRQNFCLDIAHPPELMPGAESAGADYPLRYSSRNALLKSERLFSSIPNWVFVSASGVWFFVPALIYRIAFKMSSLAWLPLLWCVSPFRPSSVSSGEKLEDLRYGAITKFALGFSAFVVVGFAVKLHVASALSWPTPTFFEREMIINTYPWHVAAAVNGALAWGFFFFADMQLRRIRRGQGWNDSTLMLTISSVLLIRRALAFYVLLNSLDFLLYEARILGNAHIEW